MFWIRPLTASGVASRYLCRLRVAQTRYLAFGDSITDGFGDELWSEDGDPDAGYPPRLEALRGVPVEKVGFGGKTTTELLNEDADPTFSRSLATVLLLMAGTNDCYATPNRHTAQRFGRNLDLQPGAAGPAGCGLRDCHDRARNGDSSLKGGTQRQEQRRQSELQSGPAQLRWRARPPTGRQLRDLDRSRRVSRAVLLELSNSRSGRASERRWLRPDGAHLQPCICARATVLHRYRERCRPSWAMSTCRPTPRSRWICGTSVPEPICPRSSCSSTASIAESLPQGDSFRSKLTIPAATAAEWHRRAASAGV